jgi:hypothetical protein
MAWLPAIEQNERLRDLLAARLSFLDKFIARVPGLLRPPGAAGEPQPESAPEDFYVGDGRPPRPGAAEITAVAALMSAAELALVTNQTGLAKGILRTAFAAATTADVAQWPILRVAVLGAALKVGRVSLQSTGLILEFDPPATPSAIRREATTRSQSFQGSALALGAALAAGGRESLTRLFLQPGSESDPPDAAATLRSVRQADILPLFGIVRLPEGLHGVAVPPDAAEHRAAMIAFFALHQRYLSRLHLLLGSGQHVTATTLRRSLFDWSLFLIHLGLARFRADLYTSDLPALLAGTDAGRLLGFMMTLVGEFEGEQGTPAQGTAGGPLAQPGGGGLVQALA